MRRVVPPVAELADVYRVSMDGPDTANNEEYGKMRFSRFYAIAGVTALASVCCFADAAGAAPAGPKPTKHPSIAQLDANKDGKISFEELKAKYPKLTEEKFKARDKNGDGFLTREDRGEGDAHSKREHNTPMKKEARSEMKTGAAHQPGQLFKKADKNGDGKVTLDEIHSISPKYSEMRFKQFDTNGDGAITPEEISHPRPGPDRDNQKSAAGKSGAKALFARTDKDRDGKITMDELKAASPKATPEKFAKLDKNKDGAITEDEISMNDARAKAQNVALLARKADTNHDGAVTYDEMLVAMPNLSRNRFDQMDVNKDGVLNGDDRAKTQNDGKQALKDGAAKLMESDANKDGKVTFEEVSAAKPGFPREAFDRVDKNKDGVLSADDMK